MENENNLICPYCGSKLKSNRSYYTHISRYHLKTMMPDEQAKYILSNPNSNFKNIPFDILKTYFIFLKNYNNLNDLFSRKFPGYYNLITAVRPFNINTDFDIFVNKLLPWRNTHPKVNNSKELCEVIFDNKEESEKLYAFMKASNPFTGHDKAFSPFSKDFIGYKTKTEEEKIDAIHTAIGTDRTDKFANQIGYWTKQGYSEEEAKKFVHNRQITFSKEICIEKYGKDAGLKRFNERQEKWLNNYKKLNYSKISQELFVKLYNKLKNNYKEFYFATFNNKDKVIEENSQHNYEYHLKLPESSVKLDFYIKDIDKAIEFDGDYWHSLHKEKDKIRDEKIKNTGITVFHVKEHDYRKDPDNIMNQCLSFIKTL